MADKAQERRYLEIMQRAVSDVPSGEVVPSETPDFLVRSPRGVIGVEVTLFHLPPQPGFQPHQELQALKDRIVRRAEQIHRNAGGMALYVTAFFSPGRSLSKAAVEPLAQALAAAVLANEPSARSMEDRRLDWSSLPSGLSDVAFSKGLGGTDRLWSADAGGWVASITAEHIHHVLDAKGRSARAARSSCDELWLLVVNDVFSRAAQAELSPEVLLDGFAHSFDRAFWLIPHVPRAYPIEPGGLRRG